MKLSTAPSLNEDWKKYANKRRVKEYYFLLFLSSGSVKQQRCIHLHGKGPTLTAVNGETDIKRHSLFIPPKHMSRNLSRKCNYHRCSKKSGFLNESLFVKDSIFVIWNGHQHQ